MLSVTLAFVVATALLFLFASTRALGVVGVFILLCLQPLLFGGLLALVGLAYYLFFRKRQSGASSKSAVASMAALLVAGGALALFVVEIAPGELSAAVPVRSAPSEELIVLRTPGGLLEVSRMEVTEMLDARIEHTVLGVLIGETQPRIRVPAVYRYHVELQPEWKVLRKDGVFTVVAPAVRPTLPVAVDFAGIEKDVAGTWLLVPITGDGDLQDLERTITAKLAERASSRDYLARQREAARRTVREFVRTWLVEQTRFSDAEYTAIRVLFADEPVRFIESLAG